MRTKIQNHALCYRKERKKKGRKEGRKEEGGKEEGKEVNNVEQKKRKMRKRENGGRKERKENEQDIKEDFWKTVESLTNLENINNFPKFVFCPHLSPPWILVISLQLWLP